MHDINGSAAGEVTLASHEFALWEKQIDALMIIRFNKGHFTVNVLCYVLGNNPVGALKNLSIMNRWITLISKKYLEAGICTTFQNSEHMSDICNRFSTY